MKTMRSLRGQDREAVKRELSSGDVLERHACHLEVRAGELDEGSRLVGHAAVFDIETDFDGFGWFREVVRPGAFTKTLADGADVRCLWNHDPNFVLGRTKSGTLRLEEDDRGLAIDDDVPDTTWARDLLVTLRRGDVDQMSFAWYTIRDRWTRDTEKEIDLREILEAKLIDVSPVTYPAYPDTDVEARSLMNAAQVKTGFDMRALAGVLARLDQGRVANTTDAETLRRSIGELRGFLQAEERRAEERAARGESHEERESGEVTGRSIDRMRKELDLAEAEV